MRRYSAALSIPSAWLLLAVGMSGCEETPTAPAAVQDAFAPQSASKLTLSLEPEVVDSTVVQTWSGNTETVTLSDSYGTAYRFVVSYDLSGSAAEIEAYVNGRYTGKAISQPDGGIKIYNETVEAWVIVDADGSTTDTEVAPPDYTRPGPDPVLEPMPIGESAYSTGLTCEGDVATLLQDPVLCDRAYYVDEVLDALVNTGVWSFLFVGATWVTVDTGGLAAEVIFAPTIGGWLWSWNGLKGAVQDLIYCDAWNNGEDVNGWVPIATKAPSGP